MKWFWPSARDHLPSVLYDRCSLNKSWIPPKYESDPPYTRTVRRRIYWSPPVVAPPLKILVSPLYFSYWRTKSERWTRTRTEPETFERTDTNGYPYMVWSRTRSRRRKEKRQERRRPPSQSRWWDGQDGSGAVPWRITGRITPTPDAEQSQWAKKSYSFHYSPREPQDNENSTIHPPNNDRLTISPPLLSKS